MRVGILRLTTCLILIVAISLPAFGMSNGPGAVNSDGDLTVKYGCSCHNNGAPSDRAVVMVTGVPLVYEQSQQYQMTVKVADSLTLSGGEGNVQAGFLMSTDGIGNFSWDESEDIRYADGRPDDISHSEPDLDGIWIVNWQHRVRMSAQFNSGLLAIPLMVAEYQMIWITGTYYPFLYSLKIP